MLDKTEKKPEGFYTLKLEIETLKKSIKELQKVANEYALQNKYLVRTMRRLSGELIQLQHEVDGIHSNDRRKKG